MKQKIGKVKTFLLNLTDALHEYLPNNWEKEGLPNPRMLRRYSWGNGGLCIQTTVTGFPSCNLYLSYGVSHQCLTPILDKISLANGWTPIHTVNQFRTDTRICSLNPEIRTVFVEDYNFCDHKKAILELMENSLEILLAYFERFSDIKEIRDSLVNREQCILGLGVAENIVAIDFVLEDFEHLKWYSQNIANEYEIKQIEKTIEILDIKLG